ncbi:MAG: acyltransferase family protein [Dorea sp.]
MDNKIETRDYLFDNYKTLLIFLVVVGHFIEPCYDNTTVLSALKWMISSFHMPAFIFISGYFSKRELPITKLIQRLVIPYLVYEAIYYLFYTFITHKETKLYLLYPKFSLWYLFALFVWRVITPWVKKIPYHMILSILAGLLIGYSHMKGNYLTLPRILVFYPFFLAGIHFDRELITRLRNRKNQIIAGLSVAVCMLFVTVGPLAQVYSPKIFYGRYHYEYLGQQPTQGLLCRIVCYLIGFILTFSLMFLVSEKHTFYSYIGSRTMAIYLFHGLTYNYIKDCTNILQNVNAFGETVLLILSCVVMTAIFSAKPFTTFTNKVANLSLPNFHHQHIDTA